jgi:site-specific recombinase XerD
MIDTISAMELTPQEMDSLERHGYLTIALNESKNRVNSTNDDATKSIEQFLMFMLTEEVAHSDIAAHIVEPAPRRRIPGRLKSHVEAVLVMVSARYLVALEAQDIMSACVEDTVRQVVRGRLDEMNNR